MKVTDFGLSRSVWVVRLNRSHSSSRVSAQWRTSSIRMNQRITPLRSGMG